jgi:hypothetical protein
MDAFTMDSESNITTYAGLAADAYKSSSPARKELAKLTPD